MGTPFATAWLRAYPHAVDLLPDRFRRPEDRAFAVADAAARQVTPAVHAALVAQNAAFAKSPARDAHLPALARPGTVAVVTGQQVGLFLGPLFTIYKAATAIAVARALAAETGRACVPVFWLQTEDHDFAEIADCLVPRASAAPLRLAIADAAGGTSRVPVGHRRLGPSVLPALASLRDAIGHEPHAAEVLDFLQDAYLPEATVSTAVAAVVATIFADEGLVLLDPRDPVLSAAAAPVHRRCILAAVPLANALMSQGLAIQAAGFGEQVHVRPGSPLCFFAPEAEDGPRYRLDATEVPETWRLVGHPEGATVSTGELLAWLDREPLRFTASALSRPLVQDTLLPTAACRWSGRGRLLRATSYALCRIRRPDAARRAACPIPGARRAPARAAQAVGSQRRRSRASGRRPGSLDGLTRCSGRVRSAGDRATACHCGVGA